MAVAKGDLTQKIEILVEGEMASASTLSVPELSVPEVSHTYGLRSGVALAAPEATAGESSTNYIQESQI
jgi:hypothetical protein